MIVRLYIEQPVISFNGVPLPWQATYLSTPASSAEYGDEESDEWWFGFCCCMGRERKANQDIVVKNTRKLLNTIETYHAKVIKKTKNAFKLEKFDPEQMVAGWKTSLILIEQLANERPISTWAGPDQTHNVKEVAVPDDFYRTDLQQ